MDTLPNELLIQIALHLDTIPPSIAKFSHEPSTTLTENDSTPLKLLSLVSWRWRKITLPILFSHCRIALDSDPQWVPIDARLVDSMQTQLTTLSAHELQIFHKMRSKFKSSSVFAYEEAYDDLLINLCRVQEGDNFLRAVPNILWLPHLSRTFTHFAAFIAKSNLKPDIKSVVVHTHKEYELRHVTTADAPLARAVADIWSLVFAHLELTRVVVAAPPATLAALLDTQLLSADTWAFDMHMHYIELRQNISPGPIHMDAACGRPWNAALIHRRPWQHVGYNEGSSISAYSTYEYHLKQSPKMLYLVLVRLAKEAPACCNIASFSFTGVFPFVTNVTAILRALHKIRSLKRVAFQLAPGPENAALDDPKRLGRAQRTDFWLEWNESYRALASYLGVFDFADGAEFASLDCQNDTLAADVTGYVEMLQQRGAGWRKREGARGVWVRDHALDMEVAPVLDIGIV